MTVATPTTRLADPKRELTPALIRGSRGSVEALEEGELAPGLEGTLSHHVFADGATAGRLLAQAREAVGSALEQPVPAGADGVG